MSHLVQVGDATNQQNQNPPRVQWRGIGRHPLAQSEEQKIQSPLNLQLNQSQRNPFARNITNMNQEPINDYVPEYERELDHKIQHRQPRPSQIQQEVFSLQSQKLSFEQLKCIVCFELPESPFDCEQCGTIICKSCFGQLHAKVCPYCQKKLPNKFKPNMCLNKIISEFEIDCTLRCGAIVKKGDMQLHLKECPEKVYECVECDQSFKRSEFRYHITREHGESMLQKFVKSNNDIEEEPDEESHRSSRRTSNYLRRVLPPGWQKFYQDPPIQLVGTPNQDNEITHLNFFDLVFSDQIHYGLGMAFYFSKWTSIFICKFALWSISTVGKFAIRTLNNGFGFLTGLFFEQNGGMIQDEEDLEEMPQAPAHPRRQRQYRN